MFMKRVCLVFSTVAICEADSNGNWNWTSPNCARACIQLMNIPESQIAFGHEVYGEAWSLFQSETQPACQFMPYTAYQVAEALSIAKKNECHFAVLGGGTSPWRGASNSDAGITIDMQYLRLLDFVPGSEERQLRVGAGNLWGDVYAYLEKQNLSATGARNSDIGVVGSVLGGGISFFSQRHGWSCDTVSSFEVVLANSTIATASPDSHPELFWALRGGGSNFGIVTALTLDTFTTVLPWQYFVSLYDLGGLRPAFKRLETQTQKLPDAIWQMATTLMWHAQEERFIVNEITIADSSPDGPAYWHPVPLKTFLSENDALNMAKKMSRMNPPSYYNYFGSITVRNYATIFLALAEVFQEEVKAIKGAQNLRVNIVYNPLTESALRQMQKRGGNALGLGPEDGPLTVININLHWSQGSDTPRMRSFMRSLIARFRNVAEERGMLHPFLFLNHAFEEDDVFLGYGEGNMAKLRRIRKEVDPEGIFQTFMPGYFKLGSGDEKIGN